MDWNGCGVTPSAWRSEAGRFAPFVDALLSVLLAPQCAGCGAILERPLTGPVCLACWHAVPLLAGPLCDRCGDPLPFRPLDGSVPRCTRCLVPGPIRRARAAGIYDGSLKAIIHAFKYDGRRSIARPLAALMRSRGNDLIARAAAAVPVPLHPSRRRHRGFNQADDLARHLGLRVVPALRRIRATATQADLPAARRQANVRGAFELTRAGIALRGEVVLLVDDVSTTGSTLDACGRALSEGGVAEVRALTAARVVGRSR